MKRLAIAAAALAALAALTATLHTGGAGAADPASTADDGGITVQGTARVSVEPDAAELSVGVEARADTARGALEANGARMREVIAALEQAGARDVKTQTVWLNPWTDENGPAGYVATNTVTAKTGADKAGALIDAAVAAGANQVSGPAMTIDDEEALYRKALEAAVEQARDRAEVLADAAGVRLGRVTAVVESSATPPMPYAARESLAADAATPIEPGEREVSASVSVTFAVA